MLERKSYFYVVIAVDKILLTVNKEQSELSEASNGLLTQRYSAFFIKRTRGKKKEGLEAGFWRDWSLNEGLILQ